MGLPSEPHHSFEPSPVTRTHSLEQGLPVPRVRRSLTPSDQRHIPKREARRPLQPAERDVLDEQEDAALTGGEVGAANGVSPSPLRQPRVMLPT